MRSRRRRSEFGYRGSALQRSRVKSHGGTVPAGQVRQSLVCEHVQRLVGAHTRPCWARGRSTWLTRRRVTPPISPASCSRVDRGHADSRSRASFSAPVSCTERAGVICSVGLRHGGLHAGGV